MEVMEAKAGATTVQFQELSPDIYWLYRLYKELSYLIDKIDIRYSFKINGS
jgi:hypothetical protein